MNNTRQTAASPSLVFVVIASLTASSTAGCSFAFTHGPPANHAELDYFQCTEGRTWPVLDLLWAGLNGLGAATALSAEGGEIETPDQVIGVGIGWLLVSGAAAIYGFSKTAQCRDAKAAQARRLRGPAGAPSAVPPTSP